MTSTVEDSKSPFFIINLSNKLRNNIYKIDNNPNTIKRKYSTSAYHLTNTLSIILSSTLTAPLYRLKLVSQTRVLYSNKPSLLEALKSKKNIVNLL